MSQSSELLAIRTLSVAYNLADTIIFNPLLLSIHPYISIQIQFYFSTLEDFQPTHLWEGDCNNPAKHI